MISVSCTITLLANKNKKVDIELSLENDGMQAWKVFQWSQPGLYFPVRSGFWEHHTDLKDFYLMAYFGASSTDPRIIVAASNIPLNFLYDLMCGKTYYTELASLLNSNPSERDVSCKLWTGCI